MVLRDVLPADWVRVELNNTDNSPTYKYRIVLEGHKDYIFVDNQHINISSIADFDACLEVLNQNDNSLVKSYDLGELGSQITWSNTYGMTLGGFSSGNNVPSNFSFHFHAFTLDDDHGGLYNYTGPEFILDNSDYSVRITFDGTGTELTANICFLAGTLVNTDQGNIPIEQLNPNINTINRKPIQYITKTFSADPKLVMVKRHAFNKNIPNKDTVMSGFHKIQIDGHLIEAYKLSYINKNVRIIDNTNEPLYNILMENHEIISVQNMSVESLHPENIIAKLYKSDLPQDKKNKLIEEISIATKTEDYVKYDLIKNYIL